ncbi:hypothetical protein FRC07_000957 [Ceratobasidium sp. 392]|nr:hypothetical protein FRC07_000957 [Ceratobasidium sp. 392]
MNNDESAKYRREILEILSSLRSLGCPIEFRSQYAEHEWKAQVLLKIEIEDRGKSRWGDEIEFGDVIVDPELIEERIKQAQLAVLHPSTDPTVFLRGNLGPGDGLSFTRNRVIVKISGRELADLSFVDLPGIIANTADQRNTGDIELVQKLISSYMRKKSTINLIVITCESDIETQAAGRLAQIYDPKGERTIGVITKPDRIEDGQQRQWIPLITGESHALANGWFCVKQPSTSEREDGCTWENARTIENAYFNTAPGWSAISAEYRTNLGTRNLAFKLGQVLSSDVHKRLPTIRDEVERLIQANNLDLSKIPDRHPYGTRDLVQQLVTRFVRDVEKHLIKGNPSAGTEGVVQLIRSAHNTLRGELQDFAPVFLPSGDNRKGELSRPSFLPADEKWLPRSPYGNEYTTTDVANYADGARTREWPGHYPFQVMLDYTEKYVQRWQHPVNLCFEKVCSVFERKLLELIGDHFGAYSYGGLLGEVKVVTMDLAERCKSNTIEVLAKELDQESHPESTHEDMYLAYEAQFAEYYRQFFDSSTGLSLLAQALEVGGNEDLAKAISILEKCGMPAISPTEWRSMYPTNRSDRSVLRIMSSVRAHYQIAFKRFADKVKDTMNQSYVYAFEKELEDALRRGLKLSSSEASEDYFTELTKESEDIFILRGILKDKAKKLATAKTRLS